MMVQITFAATNQDVDKAAGLNQGKNLDKLLSSDKAVLVQKGQFSAASPEQQRVTIPVKIAPAQFESLKKADEIFSNAKVKRR